MNRVERRAAKKEVKKEIKKAAETINRLTPEQVKLIDQVSNEKAYEKAESILISYQRVINASLAEHGFNIKQIEDIFNAANELMIEEEDKAVKLSKELRKSGDVRMAKKKIEEGIINEINALMDAGKSRKEVIEAVLFKFPNMSKAMIINAYQEAKENRREEEPEVKEALKYIFEEDKEVKEAVNNLANEVKDMVIDNMRETLKKSEKENKTMEEVKKADVNNDNNAFEEITNVAEESGWTEIVGNKEISVKEEKLEQNKLKVLSMTLRGENGTYTACEHGVELTEMGSIICFENVGQVDEFANEVKQVFEMMKA